MKKTAVALGALVAVLLAVVIVMTVGLVAVYKGDYTFKKTIVFEGFGNSDSGGSTGNSIVDTQPKSLSEALTRARNYNASLASDLEIQFELPINGSMGFTSTTVPVYDTDSLKGNKTATLSAGQAFIIKEEIDGKVWLVRTEGGTEGYISNKNCFINLPDIIPSIVYNITNSTSSIFLSSRRELPGVTGEKLFNFYMQNDRYNKKEFVAPVMYTMAKKIYAAQCAALQDGNTLVIYETFRPYETQKQVAAALQELCNSDSTVKKNVNKSPWSLSWFIATSLSTHQKGCAIDVSLASVNKVSLNDCGRFKFVEIIGFTEYEMQTEMHELSVDAVSLEKPVSGNSKTAWKSVDSSHLMTDGSLLLKDYCTDTGMSPLASEWWHFNDLEAVDELGRNFRLDYDFEISLSVPVEY